MGRNIRIILYIFMALTVLCIVGFVFFLVTQRRIIKHEQAPQVYSEWILNHEKLLNIISYLLWLLLCCVLFFGAGFPAIKDFPYLNNDDYLIIHGTALSTSQKGSFGTRYVTIINDEEKIRVTYWETIPLYEGDTATIMYLPNTKYGSIINYERGG